MGWSTPAPSFTPFLGISTSCFLGMVLQFLGGRHQSIFIQVWLGAEFGNLSQQCTKPHEYTKYTNQRANLCNLISVSTMAFYALPLGMLYCIRKSPFWDHAKCALAVKVYGCRGWSCKRLLSWVMEKCDQIQSLSGYWHRQLRLGEIFQWKSAQCFVFQSKAILAQSRLVMW